MQTPLIFNKYIKKSIDTIRDISKTKDKWVQNRHAEIR